MFTGQFIILAGLRGMNGVLEFVDTSDFTSMGGGEHFTCTGVKWDPTGRQMDENDAFARTVEIDDDLDENDAFE